jgi:hypothetical protein
MVFVCILCIASQSSDNIVRNVPRAVRAELIKRLNNTIFWDLTSCSLVCTAVLEETAAFIISILFVEVAGPYLKRWYTDGIE